MKSFNLIIFTLILCVSISHAQTTNHRYIGTGELNNACLYNNWKSKYVVQNFNITYNNQTKSAARVRWQSGALWANCVPVGTGGDWTASEGMGYGLLLAAYFDDQDLFQKLFNFYEGATYNTHGSFNRLMPWLVNQQGNYNSCFPGDGGKGSATDGDLDAAWALLVAHDKWGGNYKNRAIDIIKELQEDYVVLCNTNANGCDNHGCRWVLRPGDFGGCNTHDLSYYAAGYFREFAKLGQGVEAAKWNDLADHTYYHIADVKGSRGGVLVPDWQTSKGGEVTTDQENDYKWDASRVPWRIAMDYVWNHNAAAKTVLDDMYSGLLQYKNATEIRSGYDIAPGNPAVANFNSLPFLGGFTCALMVGGTDDKFKDYVAEMRCMTIGGGYFSETLAALYALVLSNQFTRPGLDNQAGTQMNGIGGGSCNGNSTCSATDSNDNRLEAEDATLGNGAQIYDDTAASSGQGVGWMGSVTFQNVDAAGTISMSYSSPVTAGTVSIYVNNVEQANFNITSTGAWTGNYNTASVDVNIPTGADIRIEKSTGDVGFNIDYIELSGNPTSGSAENLALSGTASQSSTGWGGVPSRGIDNNTNGAYGSGSVTHTQNNNPSWWQVELAQTSNIDQIVIWNRTDCCTNRLSNFTLSVLNENGAIVWSQTYSSAPNPSQTINLNATGKTVRISVNNYLHLAEVQVFGTATSGGNGCDNAGTIVNNGSYQIRPKSHCDNALQPDGGLVYQKTVNGNQQWQFVSVGGGYYHVKYNGSDNQCLGLKWVGNGPNGQIEVSPCNVNWGTQKWKLNAQNGGYGLENQFSDECLDIPANTSNQNTAMQQYSCHAGDAQTFILVGTSNMPSQENEDIGELIEDRNEAFSDMQTSIELYPNPATDAIHVKGIQNTGGTWSIYTTLGQLLKQYPSTSTTLDIADIDKGIYLLVLRQKDEQRIIKFVKQ